MPVASPSPPATASQALQAPYNRASQAQPTPSVPVHRSVDNRARETSVVLVAPVPPVLVHLTEQDSH